MSSPYGPPGGGQGPAQPYQQPQGFQQPPTGYGPPPQGYSPQGYPGPGYQAQPPRPRNPGAVLGWVGVGVGLLVGFIGIVMGAMSIARSRQARASTAPGWTAVVVGAIQAFVVIAVVLAQVAGLFASGSTEVVPGDTNQQRDVAPWALAAGNCLDFENWSGRSVPQVPCSQAHSGEVITSFNLDQATSASDPWIEDYATEVCSPAVNEVVPAEIDITNLSWDFLSPTDAEWNDGHRTGFCLLTDGSGTMTGSAVAGTLTVP